ncbi:YmfQ family protein [Paenibacillus sp. ACRRX]|uniref:putative phage tail protein n=1 Tax=Paenibacillus sp. ACRRX TaxID=2918206 RepID=UPI001EF55D80|nr:putative phage tail protein [Paenibacillus sp. ACRRX]MCG7410566.1 YmfQ family protein [Paenibacillus sp. ACRRX]
MRSVKVNMHKIMRQDPLVNALSGSIDVSLKNMDGRIDNFVKQLDIDTATWALVVYERELGISLDPTKPLDQRRSLVKSKLRGSGTVGAAQIKLVADSYTHGDVEVTLDKGIVIEFRSIYGIPPNLEDLKTVIRQIAPAHLSVRYVIKYTMHKDLKGLTHMKLSAFTHDQIRGGKANA